MSLGTLRDALASCCAAADQAFWFRSANIEWDLAALTSKCVVPARHFGNLSHLIKQVCELPKRRRHVVIMSNGGFDNIYEKLPTALRAFSSSQHEAPLRPRGNTDRRRGVSA